MAFRAELFGARFGSRLDWRRCWPFGKALRGMILYFPICAPLMPALRKQYPYRLHVQRIFSQVVMTFLAGSPTGIGPLVRPTAQGQRPGKYISTPNRVDKDAQHQPPRWVWRGVNVPVVCCVEQTPLFFAVAFPASDQTLFNCCLGAKVELKQQGKPARYATFAEMCSKGTIVTVVNTGFAFAGAEKDDDGPTTKKPVQVSLLCSDVGPFVVSVSGYQSGRFVATYLCMSD